MNKKEVVAALAEKSQLKKKDCELMLESLVETVTEALCEGEVVSIPGLGKFSTVERPERTGRNPQTGEEIIIEASIAPRFKVSGVLKEAVNA